MWGYGARHAALSIGVRDPLYAKAVVIDVGTEKLAIVGLDLGRSPTDAMMVRIRAAIKATSGIGLILISGSHTHHGPVIELLDEPGKGQGTFDDAVAYAKELEGKTSGDQCCSRGCSGREDWLGHKACAHESESTFED